jgi:hypothetical protein
MRSKGDVICANSTSKITRAPLPPFVGDDDDVDGDNRNERYVRGNVANMHHRLRQYFSSIRNISVV